MSRLRTATASHVREFVREPVNLVFLFVLPPVVIEVYGRAMETFPQFPFATNPGTLGRIAGTLFATAFVAGLIGLFQVISARRGDERLILAGFGRSSLLASRLVALVGATLAVAAVSLGVLATDTAVAAPGVAYAALVSGGLIYGLIGVLVGTLVPRELEGSLVLVFLADVDSALSTGIFATDAPLVDLFPLHDAHALFTDAVTDGAVATGDAVGVAAYLLAAVTAAFLAHRAVAGDGGERA
ncbi:MAG: hypothetical protein ABEJ68_09395 [Halobacteriaceae archaeon]